jgi:hypothetical protein
MASELRVPFATCGFDYVDAHPEEFFCDAT